jgi:phenylpropionate dioxygenase-like ring-hydroxylating dioxygenase large terminal subunit
MFQGFARVWTPVLGSEQLGERPMPVMLAGEKLVLFRGAQGPAALLDRCPHRGVALSLGTVRNGCIECPFHGWRFDGAGHVTHVPWNPDAKMEKLGTVALPVIESSGIIWVYTALEIEKPEPPPLVKMLAERRGSIVQETVFQAHWTRAMENALDAPHLPFIHRWTIGAGVRASAERGARMDTTFTPTEYGGRIHWSIDGATSGGQVGSLDFFAPNIMHLRFGVNPGQDQSPPDQLMAVVPIDALRTRMISIIKPGFSVFRFLSTLFGRRLMWEDQHVVESSDPPQIPEAGQELSVRSDRATLAFRKYYDDKLRHSGIDVSTSPRRSLDLVA